MQRCKASSARWREERAAAAKERAARARRAEKANLAWRDGPQPTADRYDKELAKAAARKARQEQAAAAEIPLGFYPFHLWVVS